MTVSPPTPYEQLGGAFAVQALVERFYDLMALEPAYQALRAAHGPELSNARQRLTWYLSGWLGGPPEYTDRFGHPRLRARHLPQQLGGKSIGILERDQWLACMDQAMRELAVAEPLRQALNQAFYKTADWMRNRPETPSTPAAG